MPAFLQGFQQGASLGNQRANRRMQMEESRLDRALRERTLSGQEAEFRLRSREAEKDLAIKQMQLDQFKLKAEKEAASAKVAQEFLGELGSMGTDLSAERVSDLLLRYQAKMATADPSQFPGLVDFVGKHLEQRRLEEFKPRFQTDSGITTVLGPKGQMEVIQPRATPQPSALQERLSALIAIGEATPENIREVILGGGPSPVRIAKAITDLETQVAAETNPIKKQQLERELTNLRTLTAKTGETITVTPEGTTIQRGVPGGAAPAAVTNRLLERINQGREAVSALNDLQASTRWKDVGPQGALGELVDRIAPNFGLTFLASESRMDTRQKIKQVREAVIRQISGDDRFNKEDRSRAESALPSSGIFESVPRLQRAAEDLKALLAKRGFLDSRDLKRPVESWMIEDMDDVMIGELLRTQLLDAATLAGFIEQGFLDRRRAQRIGDLSRQRR